LPDEGLDRFLDLVRHAIEEVGPDDPRLVELVLPYRQHIAEGSDLEELRSHLDRIRPTSDSTDSPDGDLPEDP
jgi:hypothetical protein